MEIQNQQDENKPAGAGNVPAPGTYSPVNVNMENTMGAIFLGIATLILLVALIRLEARYRALLRVGIQPE